MTQLDRNSTAAALATLEAQIADLKRKLDQASRKEDGNEVRERILRSLKDAGGHLTIAQIMKACQLQKSSTWLHVRKLNKDAKVRLMLDYGGRTDGRAQTVVYHADAIVV